MRAAKRAKSGVLPQLPLSIINGHILPSMLFYPLTSVFALRAVCRATRAAIDDVLPASLFWATFRRANVPFINGDPRALFDLLSRAARDLRQYGALPFRVFAEDTRCTAALQLQRGLSPVAVRMEHMAVATAYPGDDLRLTQWVRRRRLMSIEIAGAVRLVFPGPAVTNGRELRAFLMRYPMIGFDQFVVAINLNDKPDMRVMGWTAKDPITHRECKEDCRWGCERHIAIGAGNGNGQ